MNFCLPSLEAFYDATSLEHIIAFLTHISLYGTLNALICHAFLTTLRGPAKEWYTCLKLLSISSFAQLTKKFKLHFLRNVHSRSLVVILLKLKQHDETLSDFVT